MITRARVDFKRPKKIIEDNKDYTFVDMHFHTLYSDGTRRVPTVVKKARKLGIGISITDHNEIKGAIEISKYSDVLSIPGIETTSKEGIHTLNYFYHPEDLQEFYNHEILPNKRKKTYFLDIPFQELLDTSKDYNCIVSAAHPFAPSWVGVCSNAHKDFNNNGTLEKFDAFEVVNGWLFKNMNQNAVMLAENMKKGITGGSDGHRLFELGKVLTFVKEPATRDEFLSAVLKGKNFVIGKESNMLQKVYAHHQRIAEPVMNPFGCMSRGYRFITQKPVIKKFKKVFK
ncbi:PHP domain-containing protein [Candidatus Woesearchaeota archaeon]|nr:PHP domain-containing protein [Candidatus Woesearchaeota archaeon]